MADHALPPDTNAPKSGTVLLVSGELDKALLAFEIASGFQAMGMQMSMWFVLYGVNCLRKPRSPFSPAKWYEKLRGGPGRMPETDSALQHIVRGLNHDGAAHLPLSQLNYGGLGGIIMRRIMERKGICSLEGLIRNSVDLGVRFSICQICVDAMALNPDDLKYPAEVRGISSYYLETAAAHYNVVF